MSRTESPVGSVVGDESNAGVLVDQHGAALVCLADALLADRASAEALVAQVLADACAEHASVSAVDLRHDLARLTYRRCLAAGEPARFGAERGQLTTGLTARANQQRATIVLAGHCQFSIDQVAELFELPIATVAALMRAGLHDVQADGARTGQGRRR